MTLEEWEQDQDRELDERLTALFRSAPPPVPPAGFVSRTMAAVRRDPPAGGRRPLRLPWIVPATWTALAVLAAVAAYGVLGDRRLVADVCASIVTLGIRSAMWLAQMVRAGSMVVDLLETVSRVISRAMSTPQAAGGLVSMTLVAAAALSMLNKLLFSKKESSSW